MKKVLLILFTIFTSLLVYSQSEPLNVSAVHVAAPHVPFMQSYDGIGNVFEGNKFRYKNEENITSLKKWIDGYPEEVLKYKSVVEVMIFQTDPNKLSDVDLRLYDGYQAQYKMLKML